VPRLSRQTAFWLAGLTLATMLASSSAPSPLYVVFQRQWDFSAITLTSVFAVYAIALLGALLIAGSLSDHIGRRPVILAALAIQVVAMLAFATASGVEWLFVARILQGIATGMATGALSAALLDLQPESKPWLGGLAGAVAPMGGLAVGALATGLLVDYGPSPTRLVFWILLGAFVAAWSAALGMPETVRGDGAWRASLRPRIGVPLHLRSAFARALPALMSTWALGGLVLSLGPSLTATVFGEPSHLAGALTIVVMAGISAVASIFVRNVSPSTTARGGLAAVIAGLVVVVIAISSGSNAAFLAGAAICGLGFGPAFAGIFRSLAERAPVNRRAELVSAVLTASYLAFSLPAIAAGVAVTQVGLRDMAQVYGIVLIVLATLALILTRRIDAAPELAPATGGAAR
jgi:MFS family permease